MRKNWKLLNKSNWVNVKISLLMIKLGLWAEKRELFQLEVNPISKGFFGGKLHKIMLKYQVLDERKHAPMCPANHFHRMRLVFQKCTCRPGYALSLENVSMTEDWYANAIEVAYRFSRVIQFLTKCQLKFKKLLLKCKLKSK